MTSHATVIPFNSSCRVSPHTAGSAGEVAPPPKLASSARTNPDVEHPVGFGEVSTSLSEPSPYDPVSDEQFLEWAAPLAKYDPDTGLSLWRERPRELFKTDAAFKTWNKNYAWSVMGTVKADGYRVIRLGYRSRAFNIRLHRFVWAITNGPIRDGFLIDHINGCTGHNRLDNLRLVTPSENAKNNQIRSNNKSGITGVHLHVPSGKWYAFIKTNGKEKHLGTFVNIEDAAAARATAEVEHGFHPNHGRREGFNETRPFSPELYDAWSVDKAELWT